MLPTKTVSIKAVGDIAPGDNSIRGFGVYTVSRKYECDFLFEKVKAELAGADILIGNLEGTLSEQCIRKDMRLCGLPGMARSLRKSGFDIVSLANNHAFDYGPEILKETIDHCETAGLKVCGLRGTTPFYSQPVILVKNSVRIGILAYNWVGLEGARGIDEHIAVVEDSIVNYSWERTPKKDRNARFIVREKNQSVINDIKLLRGDVDVIVLMPHWGYEWTIYPPYGLTLEAKAFINAGADLIIGCHSHVAQGIERHNERVIAYSLGNFLFDGTSPLYRYGMVFQCNVGRGFIGDPIFRFVRRGDNFQPEPVSEEEDKENRAIIAKSSEAVTSQGSETQLDDELIYEQYETGYNKLKLFKVIFLFKRLISHPALIAPMLNKCLTFCKLLLMRIVGKKVRW